MNKAVEEQTREQESLKSADVDMTPLGSRILVEPAPRERKEVGGIIIPETKKEKGPREGTVLSVGPDVETQMPGGQSLFRGARVWYNEFGAFKFTQDGKEKDVVDDAFILGVLLRTDDREPDPLAVKTMWPGYWIWPRGSRVMIEWLEADDSFCNGKLIRPQSYRAKHSTGIVLSVGSGVSEETQRRIEPGTRVFFDIFSTELATYGWTHDGKRYGFIQEQDLLCPVPPRMEKRIRAASDAGMFSGTGMGA